MFLKRIKPPLSASSGVTKELLQPLERMDRSELGLVVVCFDLKSFREANLSIALSGHLRTMPFYIAVIRT